MATQSERTSHLLSLFTARLTPVNWMQRRGASGRRHFDAPSDLSQIIRVWISSSKLEAASMNVLPSGLRRWQAVQRKTAQWLEVTGLACIRWNDLLGALWWRRGCYRVSLSATKCWRGALVVRPVCMNPVKQKDTLREHVCYRFSQHVCTPDMVRVRAGDAGDGEFYCNSQR
jgi:hypothetical protein